MGDSIRLLVKGGCSCVTSPLSTTGLLSMASRIGSHFGIMEMPIGLVPRYLAC